MRQLAAPWRGTLETNAIPVPRSGVERRRLPILRDVALLRMLPTLVRRGWHVGRYGLEARRVLPRIQARTASNVLVMILPLMPCGIAES